MSKDISVYIKVYYTHGYPGKPGRTDHALDYCLFSGHLFGIRNLPRTQYNVEFVRRIQLTGRNTCWLSMIG